MSDFFIDLCTILKEAMDVSEKRYLIKGTNEFCGDQIFGVYSTEFIEVCILLAKAKYFITRS